MKKPFFCCLTLFFYLIAATIVSAEETASPQEKQPKTHHFVLVEEKSLTDLEKAFVQSSKKNKGVHQLGSLYVIALGPKPNPGYGLTIEKQEQLWEELKIYVKQTFPQKNRYYPQVITYPYLVGKLELAPYTTLSVLDAETKKPLFEEEEKDFPLIFEKKRVILDNQKVWTINFGKKLTASELKNYRIIVKKLTEAESKHPVKLIRDKKKRNLLKIQPLLPYEEGVTYLLQIDNVKSDTRTIIPFEVKAGSEKQNIEYEFDHDLSGWTGHFADLPAAYSQDSFELDFGHRIIPLKGEKLKKGLLLSGINRSDDLFMYAKKKIGPKEGLLPNTTYLVEMEVEFYTNVDPGLIGAGGSPGESVYVKAGASTIEPKEILVNGDLRMNIDKGEQASSGKNAVVIGHIAKEHTSNELYEHKKLKMAEPIKATTNSKGELWLLIGTDSGFEGRTTLYYSAIDISLEKET